MKNLTFAMLLVALSFTFLFAGSQPAFAEEITCTGTLGPITVDNVLVPDGATCTLFRTEVEGTVNVGTGSTLRAFDASVNGNIQAEGAAKVWVILGSVGGSIQHVQGGTALIDRVAITGDILLDDNNAPLTVRRNTVNGNVQAFQNEGGVAIYQNTIDANLQCLANTPAPVGGGNIVQGEKQDQCEDL